MKRPLFAVCLCLVAVVAIWLVYHSRYPEESDYDSAYQTIQALDGNVLTVTGRVYQKDNKNFYLNSVFYQVEAASLQQIFSLSENLICEYFEATEPAIGSTIKLQGHFRVFSKATNPGEFDMQRYYQTQGIVGKLEDIIILDTGEEYSLWREALYDLRSYFRERLYQIFPKKEASVMAAMLLGDKSDLDKEVKALYQENGIIHILSISGLHITIIGMGIYKTLRRLGMHGLAAALCGGIILCMYGVMTGLGISACRAIGMYLIRMLGEIVGRTYDMLTAMGVMAVVLVCINPLSLQNAGFLLSFGSIAGIGLLYPALLPQEKDKELRYEESIWRQSFKKVWEFLSDGIKQSVLTGLSVTLVTLPIQLWFYYEVPTYSIIINLLVLPFMSMVMISGLIAMLIPGFGIVGTITCVILSMYEMLCESFDSLPFAMWNPGRPKPWQIIIYYVLLLIIIVIKGWHGKIRQILIVGVAVVMFEVQLSGETVITVLDVGQGDCICIQTAEGKVYLFDCGSTSRSKVGEYVLKPYLKYYGISKIDAVFISHPDADHCNGIIELLALGKEGGITVERLILPDIDQNIYEKQLKELERAAKESEGEIPVTVRTMKAGDTWKEGENTFLCLHPPKAYVEEESNVYSLCFYVQMSEGTSFLLTGDVEKEGEEILLQEMINRRIDEVTILKVAHHGSKYSTSEELLEQISPQVALISCGENNSYGHPHEETIKRLENVGSKVLTTPEYGAIIIELGEEVRVYGFAK